MAELLKNARKTVAVSSSPPKAMREFLSVWRRASAPFALLSETESKQTGEKYDSASLQYRAPSTRASFFKYYIHDSVASCRFQLIGELSAPEVSELHGCWETAQTTISGRPLILDVREVKRIDETGRHWLAQRVNEGAVCQPEFFLARNSNGAAYNEDAAAVRLSLLGRVLGLLRCNRIEVKPTL